jgi:hypothetical protein
MATFAAWWKRLGRTGKIAVIVATVIVGLGILGALIPTEEDGGNNASPPPPAAQQPPPPPPPPPAEEPPPPPPPPPPTERPPKPIILRGSGAKVETIRLAKDSPAVFAAAHGGSSNFIIHLVGSGTEEFLFNEIGRYSGETIWVEAAAGRYRLPIEADGSWTVAITQPVPTPRARAVPGTISGRGAKVVKIRTGDDLQPIVTARHQGRSNFIVHLVGYGDTSGEEFLINEIGNYAGETLVTDMPAGSYLLQVQADGFWTITFTR